MSTRVDPALEGLDVIELHEAIAQIKSLPEELNKLVTYIRYSSLPSSCTTPKQQADYIAKTIWECGRYRFNYHSKYTSKKKGDSGPPNTRFMYNCAQNVKRQHKPQKLPTSEVKNRDKGQMETYDCGGWLTITIFDNEDHAQVQYQHGMSHKAYWRRDVPKEIQDLIETNPTLTVDQLYHDIIIPKYGVPKFDRKALNALWREQRSTQWKRDPDPHKSAVKLVQEASNLQGGTRNKPMYSVERVRLLEREGYSALAFVLPDVLRKWGGRIREIQIDSAWETNGSGYEVFSLLGELYGSGCPLGYLLVQSPKGAEKDVVSGKKEAFLTEFLSHLQENWEIRPIVTLTDKDWSEINACRAVFLDSKHQLCFWHCLRAIKTRLATLRRKPGPYNVDAAVREYDYIKLDFVPDAQVENPSKLYEKYPVSQATTPHVLVRFNGSLQGPAGGAPATQRRVFLKVNGKIQSIVRLPTTLPDSNEPVEDIDDEFDDFEDELESFLENAEDDREDDVDQEDGPNWQFEDDETTSKSGYYVFCPAPHRRQLLKLFTRHFCQHPLLFERLDSKKLTAKEIRDGAVHEMYSFCEKRGLREVWAYFWNNWYQTSHWKLWARSSSPYLSRQRTTMGVENFWRQLKHDFLHNVPRPPIDRLVWILINKVTPAYYARFTSLGSEYAAGRSKPLNSFQKYFKKSWKLLSMRKIQRSDYTTNINTWDCNCGQQKYNPYHLCKHLVQAVAPPPPSFWRNISRRRTTPLYRHSHLRSSSVAEPANTHTGGITDGDDNTASESEAGEGVPSVARTVTRAKRQRLPHARVNEDSESSEPGRPSKRVNVERQGEAREGDIPQDPSALPSDPDDIPPSDYDGYSSEAQSRITSDGEDEEFEVDEYIESLLARADAFEEAANILRSQVEHRNKVWLKAIAKSKLGKDVTDFVDDIQSYEGLRTQTTTWGRGKGRAEKEKAVYTMGYKRRTAGPSSHEESAH